MQCYLSRVQHRLVRGLGGLTLLSLYAMRMDYSLLNSLVLRGLMFSGNAFLCVFVCWCVCGIHCRGEYSIRAVAISQPPQQSFSEQGPPSQPEKAFNPVPVECFWWTE